MGLMNSITTSWSDGPMRSTHATGPSTEVGLNLGRIISLCLFSGNSDGSEAELLASWRKFRLNSVVVFSFAVGGYAGSILYSQIGADALLLPASISISVAVFNLALAAITVEPQNPCKVLTEPLLAEASLPNSGFSPHWDSKGMVRPSEVFEEAKYWEDAKYCEDDMLSTSGAVSSVSSMGSLLTSDSALDQQKQAASDRDVFTDSGADLKTPKLSAGAGTSSRLYANIIAAQVASMAKGEQRWDSVGAHKSGPNEFLIEEIRLLNEQAAHMAMLRNDIETANVTI
jgi:hypothetical protein